MVCFRGVGELAGSGGSELRTVCPLLWRRRWWGDVRRGGLGDRFCGQQSVAESRVTAKKRHGRIAEVSCTSVSLPCQRVSPSVFLSSQRRTRLLVMPVGLEAWFQQVPPVTRTWIATCVVL